MPRAYMEMFDTAFVQIMAQEPAQGVHITFNEHR